ncbi:S41 family peptidase [Zobellia nedashkovskayae]|uniref:S41 family peptidase n=1 Tax=Zobellia nedashkovskayae TaxID=2779510 RepID=UPI00188C6E8C|nr:S41 family peptidase [Zobellia nedashkovskayae]
MDKFPKIQHLIFLFSLMIIIISCKTENNKQDIKKTNSLSKIEMLDDFKIFQSIYEKANAGLYKYQNKTKIDSVFLSNKKKINNNTTYREFYNILWNVIDYTGSCHNNLHYEETREEKLKKQNVFFPLPLKHLNDKLYTNFKYKDIPVGSQIISVNDIPEKEFSKLISKYASTDGFNTTGKYAFIETSFLGYYIYYAFGEQKQFSIKYKIGASEVKEIQLPAVNIKTFKNNFNNRHLKKYENRKSDDYSYRYIDSLKTGLLTVKTFSMGGPDTLSHKKYVKFLDSVFMVIKHKRTNQLIVDVRDNGGGYDPNDLLLYSYLTNRKFKENKKAFTIFQDIPFPEYYIDDDIKELPIELKEEHTILKDGKYYQNNDFNKYWKPNKNAFQGNLILLIDPFVASAGSLFASLVKSDENTIVIGEETAGGYYGHTGHIPVNYELPNSKLILNFSIVDLEQDVEKLSDTKYGDGIIPDLNVLQSYQDFLNHKDTQLNFALELIKKNN